MGASIYSKPSLRDKNKRCLCPTVCAVFTSFVPAIEKYGSELFLYPLLLFEELGRLVPENYYGALKP